MKSLLLILTLITFSELAQSQSPPNQKRRVWDVSGTINYSQAVTISGSSTLETGSGVHIEKNSTGGIFNTSAELSFKGKVLNDGDNDNTLEFRPSLSAVSNETKNFVASGSFKSKSTGYSEEKWTAPASGIGTLLVEADDRTYIETSVGPVSITFFEVTIKGSEINFYVTGGGKTKMVTQGKRFNSAADIEGGWTKEDETPTEGEWNISSSDHDENGKICKVKKQGDGYLITGQSNITKKEFAQDGITVIATIEKTSFTIHIGNSIKPSVEVQGPRCSCKPGELLTYTATTTLKAGTFEKFEITTDNGNKSVEQSNTGGQQPKLIVFGNAKATGKTKIVAVYKTSGGKTIKSEPYEVNFCNIEKPELTDNPYNAEIGKNNYFLFSEDNPGRITIDAKTKLWLNGKENKEDEVEWEISPNPNNMFSSENYESGRKVKIRVEKLPVANNDFGNKNIKAKYDAEKCLCESEEIEVKIFFPLEAKNNPDAKDPNWFYYWKQTKAWNNAYNVKFSDPIPPPISFFGVQGSTDPGEAARFEVKADIIYLSPKITADNGAYVEPYQPARTGIDCYATSLRHEEQHRTDLTFWWGKLMVNYNALDDCDLDLVPNKIEDQLPGCKSGCDLKTFQETQHSCDGVPKSIKARVKDIEVNAYWEGWKWQVGSADKEDWSYPGKQAPQKQ